MKLKEQFDQLLDTSQEEIQKKIEEFKPWFESVSISEQLPIIFPSGQKITEYDGNCMGCRKTIIGSMLFGSIAWPVPHVAEINALGICTSCGGIVFYKGRIREKQGKLTLDQKLSDLHWRRKSLSRKSLLQRLFSLVKSQF